MKAKDTKLKNSLAELARELGVDCSPSALVTIDESALERLATHISNRTEFAKVSRSRWDDAKFWNVESSIEARSQYFTVGNAINFRFWGMTQRATVEPARGWRGGESFTGSMYLWRSLRLCVDKDLYPVLEAEFLSRLTEADFDGIFADDHGVNPLSIAKNDRIANLRDLGTKLLRQWNGQFHNVVIASRESLVAFAKLSSQFRAFDDPVLKLTMVNAILHSGSGVATFSSDVLPGIDYHLLKQLLRHGLLRPRAELAGRIERRETLKPIEGQELRRMALIAFVRLAERSGVSGEIIDNKWWWNRVKCKDKEPVCLDPLTAHTCPFYGPCEQLTELQFPIEETRYY